MITPPDTYHFYWLEFGANLAEIAEFNSAQREKIKLFGQKIWDEREDIILEIAKEIGDFEEKIEKLKEEHEKDLEKLDKEKEDEYLLGRKAGLDYAKEALKNLE